MAAGLHRILNLIGLHKEGIVSKSDVTAFQSHLLDTLVASPVHPEPITVIRDKLIFLQELFYAKCISAEEYHSSKRPLLHRLTMQGAEIDCRDVIVGTPAASTEEEWSVIDLRDKEPIEKTTEKTKHKTPIKSFISNVASWRGKGKENSMNLTRGPLGSMVLNSMNQSNISMEHQNHNRSLILMPESSPLVHIKSKPEKARRKRFRENRGMRMRTRTPPFLGLKR